MSGRVVIEIPDTPPSLNTWLSQHWRKREQDKLRWQRELNLEAHRAKLPKCDRIEASMTFRFPDRRRRDHDNFVSTLSKCLGDALRPDFISDDDSARFQVVYGAIELAVGPKRTKVALDWYCEPLEAVA